VQSHRRQQFHHETGWRLSSLKEFCYVTFGYSFTD